MLVYSHWRTNSKLSCSFCIYSFFIGLSFSCFDGCVNFLQGCSLKRSLVKTITLKCILISIALFSFFIASTRWYMELCPPFVVVLVGWCLLFVVPTSVTTGSTGQTSVDNSAPKFLKEESILIDRGQYSLSKAEANPFYSFYTGVWLSYTVIGQ